MPPQNAFQHKHGFELKALEKTAGVRRVFSPFPISS